MSSRLPRLLFALAFAALAFGVVAVEPSEAPSRTLLRAPEHAEVKSTRFVKKRPKPRLGDRAAKIALRAVGIPYRWGGASPGSGFDCSGLVYWTFRQLGIDLPHSSYALYETGRRVALSKMRPGDLVFFSGLGHMGLYIGRGRMVHAPQSGRLVEVVSLRGSNYGARLVGARRISRA